MLIGLCINERCRILQHSKITIHERITQYFANQDTA
jgi:hypothetical protein